MRRGSADRFDNLTESELTSGMRTADEGYLCVVCGAKFETGVIYPVGQKLVDARTATSMHIESDHGGMLAVLLGLPRALTGLSEIQLIVIEAIARGQSDRETAKALGGRAESTVRNHRYQLKKRFTGARIMVAISNLLSSNDDNEEAPAGFISYHADIPVDDERIVTTRAEADAILRRHTEEQGGLRLLKFPKKEKEKLVLLQRIAREFDPGVRYSEPQVNAILRPIYDDHVTIRRYLIEYRFLDRLPNGSEYWVNA